MTIIQFYSDGCMQRCDACGAQRRVDFEQLEVGVVPDAHEFTEGSAPLVVLPACDECGSVEQLSHMHDRPNDHRRGADVFAMLDQLGASHDDHDLADDDPITF